MRTVLSIPGTLISKVFDSQDLQGTRRQCFSVKAGGYSALISSSRVVGPAGY